MSNVSGKAYAMNVVTPMRPRRTWINRLLFMATRSMPSTLAGLIGLKFIHFARWVIIRRADWPDFGQKRDPLQNDYMLFCSNFNGTWDQYIDAFSDALPGGLDLLWYSSTKYPHSIPITPFKYYIRANQLDTDYYYNATPGRCAARRQIRPSGAPGAARSSPSMHPRLEPGRFRRGVAQGSGLAAERSRRRRRRSGRLERHRGRRPQPPAVRRSTPGLGETEVMPNLDGGHYFYTGLFPVRLDSVQRPDGSYTVPSHLLREALASLPNFSEASGAIRTSPFARCRSTHFVRLAVIDQPEFNGRDPVDALLQAAKGIDLLAHQPVDHFSRAWLMFAADFDAGRWRRARSLGRRPVGSDAARAARASSAHCEGFDGREGRRRLRRLSRPRPDRDDDVVQRLLDRSAALTDLSAAASSGRRWFGLAALRWRRLAALVPVHLPHRLVGLGGSCARPCASASCSASWAAYRMVDGARRAGLPDARRTATSNRC